VICVSSKQLHAVSVRDGCLLWSSAEVPAQPGIDSLWYEEDNAATAKEDASDKTHTYSAGIQRVCLDARRGIVWGAFDRTLLPLDLATGAFLAGTVQPCLPKPERRQALKLAKQQGSVLRFPAAESQFTSQLCGVEHADAAPDTRLPPRSQRLQAKWQPRSSFMPDCEDSCSELHFVAGALPQDDLIVLAGSLAGVYAVTPAGVPRWCYFPLWGGSNPGLHPEVTAVRSAGQDADNSHEPLELLQLAVVAGKRFLVGAQYSRALLCLDADTGAEMWRAEMAKALDLGASSRDTCRRRAAAERDAGQDARSSDFGALEVLPLQGLALYVADSGALGVWHISTGQHLMSVCASLLRRSVGSNCCVLVEHPAGTQCSEWCPSLETDAEAAWDTRQSETFLLHASLCIRDELGGSLLGLQLRGGVGMKETSPGEAQPALQSATGMTSVDTSRIFTLDPRRVYRSVFGRDGWRGPETPMWRLTAWRALQRGGCSWARMGGTLSCGTSLVPLHRGLSGGGVPVSRRSSAGRLLQRSTVP